MRPGARRAPRIGRVEHLRAGLAGGAGLEGRRDRGWGDSRARPTGRVRLLTELHALGIPDARPRLLSMSATAPRTPRLSPNLGVRMRFKMLKLAALAAASAGVLAVTSGAAQAATLPPRVTLENLATSRVLDSNFGGSVYTLFSNGGYYQKWNVVPTLYGTVNLVDAATGRCLDSNTSRQIYTLPCNGGSFPKRLVGGSRGGGALLRGLPPGLLPGSNAPGNPDTVFSPRGAPPSRGPHAPLPRRSGPPAS